MKQLNFRFPATGLIARDWLSQIRCAQETDTLTTCNRRKRLWKTKPKKNVKGQLETHTHYTANVDWPYLALGKVFSGSIWNGTTERRQWSHKNRRRNRKKIELNRNLNSFENCDNFFLPLSLSVWAGCFMLLTCRCLQATDDDLNLISEKHLKILTNHINTTIRDWWSSKRNEQNLFWKSISDSSTKNWFTTKYLLHNSSKTEFDNL